MLGQMIGTRSTQTVPSNHPPSAEYDRGMTRDVGMSKLVTASITFVAATTSQLQAANGTFAAFAVDDLITVEGTNLNNGIFRVLGIDTANQSYLTVDNPPETEGPITATVRTL